MISNPLTALKNVGSVDLFPRSMGQGQTVRAVIDDLKPFDRFKKCQLRRIIFTVKSPTDPPRVVHCSPFTGWHGHSPFTGVHRSPVRSQFTGERPAAPLILRFIQIHQNATKNQKKNLARLRRARIEARSHLPFTRSHFGQNLKCERYQSIQIWELRQKLFSRFKIKKIKFWKK